jgi:hypothetical protein
VRGVVKMTHQDGVQRTARPTDRSLSSATHRKALGQEPRQTSLGNFLLRGWQIVF